MEENLTLTDFRFSKPNPTEECRVNIFWLVLELCLLCVIVAGNLLVILSILVVKALRNPNNSLLLFLAVADMLVGLVVLPFKISLTQNCDHWQVGDFLCYFWISVDMMCCTASVLGLSMISIDRYIAIAHPLFYKVNRTPCKFYTGISITWILSFLVAISQLTHADLYKNVEMGNTHFSVCINVQLPWQQISGAVFVFFLPLCIMTFVYGTIWKILVRQKPKLSAYNGTHTECKRLPGGPPSTPCILCKFLREKKGCIMLGIVMGVFVLSYLPIFTILLLNAIYELSGDKLGGQEYIYNTFIWMGYFNSCANPFIYTMFNADFRYAFNELICLRWSSVNSRFRNAKYAKQVGSSSGTDQSTMSLKSKATTRQNQLGHSSVTHEILSFN